MKGRVTRITPRTITRVLWLGGARAVGYSEMRKTVALLGRLYAKGKVPRTKRLLRARQRDFLNAAYTHLRQWRFARNMTELEEKLRKKARARYLTIRATSSLALVLLRTAVPTLDPKNASAMADKLEQASKKNIPTARFKQFLEETHGIDGRDRRRK